MQKTRARPGSRSTQAGRTLSLAIRCGANLLPVKGLIYAISHAKASRHVTGSSRRGADESVRKMSKALRELTDLAANLQGMREITGDELFASIRGAASSYVDTFYALDSKERDLYLTSCVGHHGKKVPNEQNLLLIPALMASRGEPRAKVIAFLASSIYRIPFRVLYHSSKAAIHIELLEQAMGIKSAPDAAMKRFSDSLGEIAEMMDGIEEGKINPESDEEIKRDFVDHAVQLSQSSDMKIADFISEKIMPNAFTDRLARKIIRRL